jgi:hypothetical protein
MTPRFLAESEREIVAVPSGREREKESEKVSGEWK